MELSISENLWIDAGQTSQIEGNDGLREENIPTIAQEVGICTAKDGN